MKVVIIEDEQPAAEKLERYLQKYDPKMDVLIALASVKETVRWFQQSQGRYDLIFMDIQLSDGLSFEIFDQVELDKPIIFTTAFDEYAIDAFKVNSIDFLLKPITFMDLSKALKKYDALKAQLSNQSSYSRVLKKLAQRTYKDRFLVKLGNHIQPIQTAEVSFFYAEGRDVYLITKENKKFIIDYKLEDLQNLLDPKSFYRVNRSFIIHFESIQDIVVYSNSRLKIHLPLETEKEVIVSRERVGDFKKWLEGGS